MSLKGAKPVEHVCAFVKFLKKLGVGAKPSTGRLRGIFQKSGVGAKPSTGRLREISEKSGVGAKPIMGANPVEYGNSLRPMACCLPIHCGISLKLVGKGAL